jgi:serine/threonine protein kinase
MAPEIVAERPYGRPVDWWAFGVLLYEMSLGKPPFMGNTLDKLFTAILSDDPVFPLNQDKNAVDIIQKVFVSLIKASTERSRKAAWQF